jgi:capsule polysaccharide export protein KpsE/RkpR
MPVSETTTKSEPAVETTAKNYVALGTETYRIAVDAVASANQRLLDYWKSVWDITWTPYASKDIEAAVRENFDRTARILKITIEELRAQEKEAQELADKVLAQGEKVQDATVATLRNILDKSIVNLKHVKDSTTERLEELKTRVNKETGDAK